MPVLAFVEAVLIPISELRLERAVRKANNGGTGSDGGDEQKPLASKGAPPDTVFSVHRDEKYGGSIHFSTYDALRDAFENRDVHLKDLKGAVAEESSAFSGPSGHGLKNTRSGGWSPSWCIPLLWQKRRRKVRVFIPSLTVRWLRKVGVGERVSPSSISGKGEKNANPAKTDGVANASTTPGQADGLQ